MVVHNKDVAQTIFEEVFNKIDARPERLVVTVLLQKDRELKEIFLIPNRNEPFLSEEQARAEAEEGQSIYRVDITRIQ